MDNGYHCQSSYSFLFQPKKFGKMTACFSIFRLSQILIWFCIWFCKYMCICNVRYYTVNYYKAVNLGQTSREKKHQGVCLGLWSWSGSGSFDLNGLFPVPKEVICHSTDSICCCKSKSQTGWQASGVCQFRFPITY